MIANHPSLPLSSMPFSQQQACNHNINTTIATSSSSSSLDIVASHVEICANEATQYFCDYFNLRCVQKRADIQFKFPPHDEASQSSQSVHQLITSLLPTLTTQIQDHYRNSALRIRELVHSNGHHSVETDEIYQCLYTKFVKNCMECMVSVGDGDTAPCALLPESVYNDTLRNITKRFESTLNKLCHREGIMPPIRIAKFNIADHDTLNLPSQPPALSSTLRSCSVNSDHSNSPHSPRDTSSVTAVYDGEPGRSNLASSNMKAECKKRGNQHKDQNAANSASANYNVPCNGPNGSMPSQISLNHSIFNLYNNNNHNQHAGSHITVPSLSHSNTANRTFQSTPSLSQYRQPMQNLYRTQNRHQRRAGVQSHIQSLQSQCTNSHSASTFPPPPFPLPSQLNAPPPPPPIATSIMNQTAYPLAHSSSSAPHYFTAPRPVRPQPAAAPFYPHTVTTQQHSPHHIHSHSYSSPSNTTIAATVHAPHSNMPAHHHHGHYNYQHAHNGYAHHLHYGHNTHPAVMPSNLYPANNTMTMSTASNIHTSEWDDYELMLNDYVHSEDDFAAHVKYGEACLTELSPKSTRNSRKLKAEYESITRRFLKALQFGLDLEIVKLYKIRNDKLLDDYDHKKRSIQRGLDGDASKLNEKCLYHGTNIHCIGKIMTQGFLRQFTTRHAFGHGCYFAVNPAYSANPQYAVPNKQGIQFVFVCKVVCGEYCRGNARMKVPDIKPNTNNILYETTCDNTQKPSIFVTFSDNQAIPTHLIAFRNKNLNKMCPH